MEPNEKLSTPYDFASNNEIKMRVKRIEQPEVWNANYSSNSTSRKRSFP